MDHAQAEELFSSYWDRELAPDESARLEEHLAACADCKRDYEAFRAVVGGLGSLERQIAPAGFAEGVIRRLRKRSRGRFFGTIAVVRRVDRIPYELFSVLMLGILVAIYVVLELSQPAQLNLP